MADDALSLSDETAYVERLRALQRENWPAGIPREPAYPHGERPIGHYVRRWAEETPDRAAFNFYGREVTFAELDRLSDRFAALLHAEGVRPGDPVAVFLGNCPQFAVAFLGILKLGAVHVPVSPMFKEHELVHELTDTGAQVIVAQDALVPLVQSVADRAPMRLILSTGLGDMLPDTPAIPVPQGLAPSAGTPEGARDLLEALEAADGPVPPLFEDLDAPAALNYTGGTTGMPKGCLHTQRDMIYTCATTCTIATPMKPGDVTLCFYPLFWVAGEDMGLLFPLFSGATCVLLARWDPVAFMAAVERFRVTHAAMLVDSAVEVMEHPRAREFDLTSLDAVRVSSFVKKLNVDFRSRWRNLTGSTMIEAAWGMTETHTCDTFTAGFQDDDYDLTVQPVFVGMPAPGTDFKICDFETGALKPLGEEGEICVRTPSNLKEYWRRPEATAEAIRNGWLHTGDIGVLDEKGLLHFLGRRKEMLKVKGMSVFPAEIEAMLGQHPAILGSGVIGRPDEERGQVPVAFILVAPEKRGEVDEAALLAWCGDCMAGYKRPEIRLVEALPMTATGKVKKEELAKLL